MVVVLQARSQRCSPSMPPGPRHFRSCKAPFGDWRRVTISVARRGGLQLAARRQLGRSVRRPPLRPSRASSWQACGYYAAPLPHSLPPPVVSPAY
eukprot:72636-Chlamydomonas_euryale.AAC.1